MRGLAPIFVVVALLAAVPLIIASNVVLNFLVVALLIPAAAGTYRLEPAGPPASVTTRALVAYVPISSAATRADLIGRGFADTDVDVFLAQFAPAADLGQAPGARAKGAARP